MFGFFTAKWRNIRKNHKRTSGMEHIFKYYINIVTASCDIHIEIDLRTNIIFCNMQFMYLVYKVNIKLVKRDEKS